MLQRVDHCSGILTTFHPEYLETCLLDTCPIKSIQDIIDSGVYPPGDDTREWLDAMVDYPLSPSEDPACTTYEDMKTGGEDLVLSMYVLQIQYCM